MGFLRTDYSEVGGFEVLPIGEYEAIVSEVKVDKSKAGEPMLKVTLTIRDDVDQAGKKRKIFENTVERDTLKWKFQQMGKACGIPAGEDFETLADFAKAIQYKCVRVKLGQREYNGEMQNNVAWWAEPKFGGNADASYDDPFAGNGSINISDEDLPF